MKVLAMIALVCLLGISKGCDSSAQCQNGGSCNDGVCQCIPGLQGTRCELVDCSKVNPCLNDGACVTVKESGSCNCAQGFSGFLCETTDALVNAQKRYGYGKPKYGYGKGKKYGHGR